MSEEYNEDIDSTNDEQEVDTAESQESDEEQSSDDSNELTEREKQFLARAKKAEAKLKAKASIDEPIKKTNKPTNLSTSEEVQREVFLATGGTIEQLEVLDSIVGESLAQKKQSPLYKAYLAQEQSRQVDNQASLGTDRTGKKVVTREQTREEKIAAYQKRLKELNG